MTAIMTITIVLAIINAILAAAVGAVYFRNHTQIRSPLTMALSLFAVFFVVHNGLLVYHLSTMMATFSAQAEAFVLAEGVLQLAALSALAYATLR